MKTKNAAEESINGTADGSHEERTIALEKALRQFAQKHIPLEGGTPLGASIESIFDGSVVFRVYGENGVDGSIVSSPFLKIDYNVSFENGVFSFSFAKLRTVKKSVAFTGDQQFGEFSGKESVSIATESDEDWEDDEAIEGDGDVSVSFENAELQLMESVSETEDARALSLHGRVFLEQAPEAARQRFEKEGIVRAKVPVINIGELTANGNRYTAQCASHLERDIRRLQAIRSKGSLLEISGAPWPTGAMYPSHQPARGAEGPERFLSIVSRVTGTKRESVNGSEFLFVTFETLRTSVGKDMAILLLDHPEFVPGVSLRGIAKEESPNDKGGFDVDRLQLEGFGVDFTNNPAMPGVKEIGITLESVQSSESKVARYLTEDDLVDPIQALLKKLKESESPEDRAAHDAIKAKLEDGTLAVSKVSDLETAVNRFKGEADEARNIRAMGVADSVAGRWEAKLTEEKSFSPAAIKKLMESAKATIRDAAKALIKDRPNLEVGTDAFADALWSKVESVLSANRDDLKAILTEEVKARKLSDAPKIEESRVADEGMDGLFTPPNVNAMDPRHRRMEEDNERTGFGTGRKKPDGEPFVVPLKDAIMSAAWNTPMYEADAMGNPVHIMQKYMPHKRQAAQEVGRHYEQEAFVVREGQTSWTDAMLRQSDLWEKVILPLERREKLEASALTSAGVLGTLIPSVRQGIIESAFALSKWLSVATLNPINTPDYEVWEEEYARQDTVKQFDATWTGGTPSFTNGTAGTEPGRLFALIVTPPSGGTVCGMKITFTNQNGDSVSGALYIPYTVSAGDMVEFRPGYDAGTNSIDSLPGDRVVDVTAVAAASGDDVVTADIDLVHWKLLSGANETDGTLTGGAKLELVKRTGTVDEFDLLFELSWRLVEDSLKALAATGPGRYDAPAALTRAVSMDFANSIDARGFAALNNTSNYDASNNVTHDLSATLSGTPWANSLQVGYAEWLHNKLVRLASNIYDWGLEKPNRLVINSNDVDKLLWMKGDFITQFERKAETFFQSLAWGTVAGMEVYDAPFQHRGILYALAGSRVIHNSYIPLEFRGPYSFVDRKKTNIWVARSRTKDLFTKPKTRGRLKVTGESVFNI